jgi:transposase
MARGDLTDNQWERLEPHLPPRKPKRGRPNADHRRIINGMLWIDRTGSPWRDLPEKYGPWRTVASRFYRWQKAGVWDRILKGLQSHKDAEGELDWEVHYLDSTIVRAHHSMRLGQKGGPKAPSSRLLSGRLLHQGPHPIRTERQTDGFLCKRGAKKRDGGLLGAYGEWRDQTLGSSWPS